MHEAEMYRNTKIVKKILIQICMQKIDFSGPFGKKPASGPVL
jgi:hypothetical protein